VRSIRRDPQDLADVGVSISPELDVRAVRYSYRGIRAVTDVSLHVRTGEIVALVGANGAGKSTTVKMIAGALRPESGRITWGSAEITGLPSHAVVKRGVTLVPEGRLVFQALSVEENLRVAGEVRAARDVVTRRLDHVFSVFPRLAERRTQSAGSLSGGEQQMLAIARGMMTAPRLMILDEPSLGLAPQLVAMMFGLVRTLNAEGTSIVLVEQNVHAALSLAHRAYVLEKGRVALEGTGAALLGNPTVRQLYLGR
jgi:branched-chain amino acid transport system ATP-binding protein